MRIQQVQSSINFEAKKRRFIDLESQEQLIQILRKMDENTFYKEISGHFESKKTVRIDLFDHNHNKKAELIDMRGNLKKLDEGKDIYNTTTLTIGKTQVSINNKTGEIKEWEKPFFSSWNTILKKIKNTLSEINTAYHQPERVHKYKLGIEGLTKEAYNKLLQMLKAKK
ncbi:hypothetical protein J6R97_04845 [bacterium]|nr:hypothetical protein [bacterium]